MQSIHRDAFLAILRVKLRLDLRIGGLKNPNKPAATGLLLTCAVDHLFGWVFGRSCMDSGAVPCALSFSDYPWWVKMVLPTYPFDPARGGYEQAEPKDEPCGWMQKSTWQVVPPNAAEA